MPNRVSMNRTIDGGSIAAAIIGGLIGLQTAATAQEPESLTVDVGDCVGLESPEERLACFEARVAAEEKARESAPASQERSAAAGGEQPPASAPPEPAAPADAASSSTVQEFTGTITALRQRMPNSFEITLDNGQIWRQNAPKRYPLRIGQRVRVHSTTWGSAFRLTVDGANGFIQVERVR